MANEGQKRALTEILKTVMNQSRFVAQISADVSALKSVVCALGPEVRSALEEQMALERERIKNITDTQEALLKALVHGISSTPS
jgi:hypothetical protein